MCDPFVVFLAYVGLFAGALWVLFLAIAVRMSILRSRRNGGMDGN